MLNLILILLEKSLLNGVNDGIFKLAFDECMNLKNTNKNIELIIDSTFINNKYRIEEIALNTDNKKKRSSKLSIITDEDKFIYSIINIKINLIDTIKVNKRLKKNLNKEKLLYMMLKQYNQYLIVLI